MADIVQTLARIETARVDYAGTDARFFPGIGGREFLDPSGTFEDNGKDLILGKEETNEDHGNFTVRRVYAPVFNDPRKPQLDTDDLGLYPAYLRYEAFGGEPEWCLERARVTLVGDDGSTHKCDNIRLDKVADNHRIWLGQKYGKQLFLHNTHRSGGQA